MCICVCVQAVVHITVQWSAQVGVAPLEIRHRLGRTPTGTFARRIVVQVPDDLPVLSQTKCSPTLPPECPNALIM